MDKKKRYYTKGEKVWVCELESPGIVMDVHKDDLTMTVMTLDSNPGGEGMEYTDKLWKFEKYREETEPEGKVAYFSSVNGGVIPTKNPENAGRDCYARIEPKVVDGKKIRELHIPRMTLAKIPLGFASYLHPEDVLSLKHERSSIGSIGLLNLSGLIDSTYQGEVVLQVVPLFADVVLTNEVEETFYDDVTDTYFIPISKAVAQAVIFKQSEAQDRSIPYAELLKKPSMRGTGGWGSTGK